MINAKYITHSGDDLLVVNAARVSFSKASDWERQCDTGYVGDDATWARATMLPTREFGEYGILSERDAKLIGYLAKHHHWTPFAHPQITLHISAPIFVARQCFKHKVGLVENEISRRYVDDEPTFYMPTTWRGRAENAKQGSAGTVAALMHAPGHEDLWGDLDNAHHPTLHVAYANQCALDMYRALITSGVAPEQARMVLPQSMMTEWFWTGSLAAYARFCKQRMSKDAQAETGDVARLCAAVIEPLFPVSWKALTS